MRYILKKSNNLDISNYIKKLESFNIKKHIFVHYEDSSEKEDVYIIEINNVNELNEIMKVLNKDLILKNDNYMIDEFNPIDPKLEIPERAIIIYDDWMEV